MFKSCKDIEEYIEIIKKDNERILFLKDLVGLKKNKIKFL